MNERTFPNGNTSSVTPYLPSATNVLGNLMGGKMARASNCRFRNFLFLFYCDRTLDIWSRGVFFRLDSTQNRPVLYLSTLNHHVELDHRLARYR